MLLFRIIKLVLFWRVTFDIEDGLLDGIEYMIVAYDGQYSFPLLAFSHGSSMSSLLFDELIISLTYNT